MLWEGTEQAYSFFAFLSISKLSLSLLFSLYLTLDIGINPPLPFFLFLFGALVYCLRPFCFSVVLFFLLESLIAFLLLSSLSFLYGVQLYSVWNRMPLLYCVFPLSITFENSSLVCVSLSLSLSLSSLSFSLSLSHAPSISLRNRISCCITVCSCVSLSFFHCLTLILSPLSTYATISLVIY